VSLKAEFAGGTFAEKRQEQGDLIPFDHIASSAKT
jgi:hypothetical protein